MSKDVRRMRYDIIFKKDPTEIYYEAQHKWLKYIISMSLGHYIRKQDIRGHPAVVSDSTPDNHAITYKY